MCFYVIYEWSHSHKLLLDAASVPTYNDKICHLDVLGPNHLFQIWNLGLKIRRWWRDNPMCTPTNPKREQPLTYHKKQKIKSNQTISLVQPIYSSTYISWINFCIIFMYINTFIFLSKQFYWFWHFTRLVIPVKTERWYFCHLLFQL